MIITHSPFHCDICDKSFLRASTLKIHIRRHTGERPYKCPYEKCEKAFSESGNLKTHIKVHVSSNLNIKENKSENIKTNKFEVINNIEDHNENFSSSQQMNEMEKLRLNDTDIIKEAFEKVQSDSFYQSPSNSPRIKLLYSSPIMKNEMLFPFSVGSKSNCTKSTTVGPHMDFSSFMNRQQYNNYSNLNFTNPVFEIDDFSPSILQTNGAIQKPDYLCKLNDN